MFAAIPVMTKKTADFGPKCLITGSAGFVGRALTRALLERGYTVHGLDMRKGSIEDRKLKTFIGDIRDYGMVRAATEGCRTVFHCASVMNFLGLCRPSIRREVHGINVTGTENVVRACREAGVSGLVYTSSHCVCYDPDGVRDGDESRPYSKRYLDLYGITKTKAEKIVLAANEANGLHTIALRPGGLWGPDDDCYMLAKFLPQLFKGRLVATIGKAGAMIDFTHIDNLVQTKLLAAAALVERPELVGGRAYFVMDDEPMNLMQWLRPLIEAFGYEVPARSIPAAPMYALAFLAECLHYIGGPRPFMTRLEVHNMSSVFTFRSERARRDLGYRPTIGNADGMKECIRHFKNDSKIRQCAVNPKTKKRL